MTVVWAKIHYFYNLRSHVVMVPWSSCGNLPSSNYLPLLVFFLSLSLSSFPLSVCMRECVLCVCVLILPVCFGGGVSMLLRLPG